MNGSNALDRARLFISYRRARARHFGDRSLFAEPAWDIMLKLYVHHVKNEPVSVKSACIGSGVSASTALRWLNALEAEGLICFELDPADQSRKLIRLTPGGFESMTRCLEDCAP
jgi:DNA-binding MarR family transcriptional regulator